MAIEPKIYDTLQPITRYLIERAIEDGLIKRGAVNEKKFRKEN